jgi:hypothetical protein
MFSASNNAICNTLATRKSLKEAPITLDIKKNEAPVLYDEVPKRFFKYAYIDVRFNL